MQPSTSTKSAPRPGTLRHMALQQFYRSLTARSFEPGMTSWDHVSPEQCRAWTAERDLIANLTPADVVAQARVSLAFHQQKEIEVAFELDCLRTGKSKCAPAFVPQVIDATSKLLAHHRDEIERISAGIDQLTVSHPTTQAAE